MPESTKRKIAVLATNGVEESEMMKPVEALQAAGAETTLVSLEAGQIQAMRWDVEAVGKYEVELTAKEIVR